MMIRNFFGNGKGNISTNVIILPFAKLSNVTKM